MDRYKPIALFVGILVASNAVAQILGWHRVGLSSDATGNVGLVYLGVIFVIMAVATYRWTVRYPSSQASADLGLILLISGLIVVLIMPYLGDLQYLHHHHWAKYARSPFIGGAGSFFSKIWTYLGASLAGILIGALIAMALGRDYRARQLKSFAARKTARPVRTVRR